MWARKQDLTIDKVKEEKTLVLWSWYERRKVGGACTAGCAARAKGWMSGWIRAEAGK